MGRPAQPGRPGLRARPHAFVARFRRAGAHAVRAVSRGLPRRRGARRLRPARRPEALHLDPIRRRHGDADRAPRRRGGELARHLDGRLCRHGARRPAGQPGAQADPQRRRAGHRQGGAGAHRRLPRRGAGVRQPRGGGKIRAHHRRTFRRAQRCAVARPGRELGAQERGRNLAPALRSAHRRTLSRHAAGEGPGAVGPVRCGALSHAAHPRRALRCRVARKRRGHGAPRPESESRRVQGHRPRADAAACRSDRGRPRFPTPRRTVVKKSLLLLAVLATPAFAQQSTLDSVRSKGYVQCGVNTGVAGFSAPDSKGAWRGIDVDLCRAVAAAVFGDNTKVRYTPLTAQQRFTALQSGEVDILSRNTTWTITRDTSLGLNFVGVNYYDGQGFMVHRDLGSKTSAKGKGKDAKKGAKGGGGITSAKQLNGATVCVQPGTTTELNLADYFRTNKMTFKPVVIEKLDEVLNAYFARRCDVYTTDHSGLISTRATPAPKPEAHVILPEIISKEPLGPAVRHGDDRWFDVVKWSMFAMVEAEELGLS